MISNLNGQALHCQFEGPISALRSSKSLGSLVESAQCPACEDLHLSMQEMGSTCLAQPDSSESLALCSCGVSFFHSCAFLQNLRTTNPKEPAHGLANRCRSQGAILTDSDAPTAVPFNELCAALG